jgi:hypothetical protein
MAHFVISNIAHRKIRRYALLDVSVSRYHTDMQKVSKPVTGGSPARRGSTTANRFSTWPKLRLHANSAGLRIRKVRWFILLVSAAFLILAVVLIRPGRNKSDDVDLSYTQPITVVQASSMPAGEGAQESTSSGETAGHPQADLSSGFYDFGSISSQAVVQRDFLLINNGNAPLVISKAHTTCGCTTANLTASIIPPGQASRITMVFNAGFHDVAGQTVRRGLILTTNDPDHPELEIWVQASVR